MERRGGKPLYMQAALRAAGAFVEVVYLVVQPAIEEEGGGKKRINGEACCGSIVSQRKGQIDETNLF